MIHIVKKHSDRERGNPLPPHRLLFSISSKGSFICFILQTGLHIPRPLLHQSWGTGWNEKQPNCTYGDINHIGRNPVADPEHGREGGGGQEIHLSLNSLFYNFKFSNAKY